MKFFVTHIIFIFSLTSIGCSSIPKKDDDEKQIFSVISNYRNSFKSKSLSDMEKTVDQDLLVIEGVHVNRGWSDFRDNHIGPEMKEWKSFEVISTKPLKTDISNNYGVVSEESLYSIQSDKGTTELKALETFVLKKETSWKISTIHFSGKAVNTIKNSKSK